MRRAGRKHHAVQVPQSVCQPAHHRPVPRPPHAVCTAEQRARPSWY